MIALDRSLAAGFRLLGGLVSALLIAALGPASAFAQDPTTLPLELAVSRTVAPATAGAVQNNRVTVSYVVFNRQATVVTGVMLATTLRPGVGVASASPLPDRKGQELAWSLGTLAPFASRTVQLTVSVPNPIPLQLDGGARAFATLNARAATALAPAAALRTGAVDEALLRSTPDANTTDPFVLAKVGELGHDPVRIFAFMRDEIGYEAYRGSLRGARGTLWSRAGNALDRASLALALLRASGIPARYVRGTLSDGLARQRILSMFPPSLKVVGKVPAGTTVADPASDAALVGEARDHFWVEFDAGSGFQTADPSFPDAQVGQTFTAPIERFAEVPDALRHRVTVRVMAETATAAGATFGLGPGMTEVLTETFGSAELVGRPLTVGHFVNSQSLAAPVFSSTTTVFSPYLRVSDDPGDGSSDLVFRGTDYQEVLTNFPLGSQFVLGVFADVTLRAPDGGETTYRRTIADRIGLAARLRGSGSTSIDPTGPPLLTVFDLVTISVLTSRRDLGHLGALAARSPAQLAGFTAFATRFTGATSEQQEAMATEASQEIHELLTAVHRSRLADFEVRATLAAEALAGTSLVRAYLDSPRLTTIASRLETRDTTSVVRLSLDLRRNAMRAVVAPGQSTAAAIGFTLGRGVTENVIEGDVLTVPEAGPADPVKLPITTARIFQAAEIQGIALTLLVPGDVAAVEHLPVSADAKALMTAALAGGKNVMVPVAPVVIDGASLTSWYELDQVTGDVVGVLEDGSHGAAFAEHAFNLVNMAATRGPAAQFMLGFTAGVLRVGFSRVIAQLLATALIDIFDFQLLQTGSTIKVAVKLAFQIVNSWFNADPFLQFILARAPLPFRLGYEAAVAAIGYFGADPPVPDAFLGTGVLADPTVARADVSVASTRTPGALQGSIAAPSSRVFGDLAATWSTTAVSNLQLAALGTAAASVTDDVGGVVGSGSVAMTDGPAVAAAISGNVSIAVTGQGELAFYAAATTGLGVSGEWSSYAVNLTGSAAIQLTTDRLTVNGARLPMGTYTIAATSATASGAGPSTAPDFIGTVALSASNAVLNVGAGSGTVTLAGAHFDSSRGFTAVGFTGSIAITADSDTDTLTIQGSAAHVVRAFAAPETVGATQGTPGGFQIGVESTLTDTYEMRVDAPPGWAVSVSGTGGASVTPPAGLQGGVVVVRATVLSRTRPELVAAIDVPVTLAGTQPGVTVQLAPESQLTIPVNGAQVPSAFRATVRNLGPAADTFALSFPTIPPAFELIATETTIAVPAGATAIVGVYLQPTGPIPTAGTAAPFAVLVRSATNAAISATASQAFVVPEIHGVVVSAEPSQLSGAPGSTVGSELTLRAVGNVPEQVTVTATVPGGLSLTGLASPIALAPGQVVVQPLTMTTATTVPLNSTLAASITAAFGPAGAPLTDLTQVTVEVVMPGAQSAIDASIAARNAGQGALADTLRDLGLAITDLFGAPADPILRARVLADLDRLVEQLVDPAFAGLVAQLRNIRGAIAGGTPQSLPTDLAALDGALNEVGNATAAVGRHRFEARLQPNSQVASPQVPVNFLLSVLNTGTQTTTYQLSVEGLPASVNSQLSAASVTLAPGQASTNLGVVLTQTSATALVPVGFDVRITPTLAPELTRTVSGSLTARSEIVSVVNVTATPPFAPAGTSRALAARLLNAVNQVRQASIAFVVKGPTGAVAHQGSSAPFALGVLASLATVDLGPLDTAGLASGTYTIEVTVKDGSGSAIPGAIGTGTFLVGTPVTASIAVDPEVVAAGTRMVNATLQIDSQVPLSTQFAQIAQLPGPAHSVAVKGEVAYFCGPNGIQIVDVSDPENPQVEGSFGAGEIVNSGFTYCKISGDHLIVRTAVNNNITMQLRVYSLANPTAPQILSTTAASADYFFAADLIVAGPSVLVPTLGFCFVLSSNDVFEHWGDVVAFDISNPAAPTFASALFDGPIRNLFGCLARGGPSNMWQAALADPTTLLVGTSTAQGTDTDAGVGRIRVIDIANPAQLSIVEAGELRIPGTVHLVALAKDGTRGVALGSTRGWKDRESELGLNGDVVVATLDLANPRAPALIATRVLDRRARNLNRVEVIGGGLFIASSLGGPGESPQVLLIDARDPENPIVSPVNVPVDVLITAVTGDIVYATSANGFSIYRLGGIGTIPVTAQVQIPKATGVAILPGSFNDDPDEIVAGAQFDTLVWRRGLAAGATSLRFTWREQVVDVQPGEAREVTQNTTVEFVSQGAEGQIPLAPLTVLAEQVLALDPSTRTARPGAEASYTITLKNPSTSSIDYTLTVEGIPEGWVVLSSAVTAPAGSTQQIPLSMRAEALAAIGEYGFAVNARALGIEASVLGTLVLAGAPVLPDGTVRSVVTSLTPAQATAGQGTAALFTLRVTNVGSVTDTYAVTIAAPPGFTTTANPVSVEVPVGVGNFREVQLAVVPAPGTSTGSTGISARVTSTADTTVFSDAAGTVTVVAVGVSVVLNPLAGAPGSTFQMTVRNTGTVTDTFDLSLGGPAAVASTLGTPSVTLAPGGSQIVSVSVGSINFAPRGALNLTGVATARSNTAVRGSATAQIAIAETAGITAAFDPALVNLSAPGGAAFQLQVRSTGNREDSYQASIVATTGPISASLSDLEGSPVQNLPLFRIPGLSTAALVLDASLRSGGQGTVTVRVQSLTDQSVVAEAVATLRTQGATTNTPPTASAGLDQQVAVGAVAILDGSASQDPDGGPQPLTFAWTFVSTPGASVLDDSKIDGASTAQASFEPDVSGTYVLRLTVSDGEASASDEVLVQVQNSAPVAVAGRDRNVARGSVVTLDGSDSFDADGDLIRYEWTFQSVPAGSGLTDASLAGGTTPEPSFIPDLAGTYVLKLVVRDEAATSAPSLVTVRAWAANVPPNAHAGPDRHAPVGVAASLDGSASADPDGGPRPLAYAWRAVDVPAGSLVTTASVSGANQARASFMPDRAGIYRMVLRVDDGTAFAEDEVTITAQAVNVAPNANAGSNIVAAVGVLLTLDGSTSVDPDRSPAPLTYQWRFVSLPQGSGLANAQIADADRAQARFRPDVAGAYVLELTVFDGAAGDFDNVLVVARETSGPTCFGRVATIYVREGRIVGGPDDGKPFRGELRGTPGDDVIVGTPHKDRITGNGGNDVMCGGDGSDVIEGGPGHDMVDGGPGNDLIKTHGGNDYIIGGDGNDSIEAGDGDDVVEGGQGNDLIKGQSGNDVLRGGAGDDVIEGGPGSDVLRGDSGRDFLKGQDGDDLIEGGPDADRLDGGPGGDECHDEETNVKSCER